MTRPVNSAPGSRRRYAQHQDPGTSEREAVRTPSFNISAIHVGGDLAGLFFAAGTIVIFIIGMPSLRWFLLTSVGAAALVAILRFAWKKTHSGMRPRPLTLRLLALVMVVGQLALAGAVFV